MNPVNPQIEAYLDRLTRPLALTLSPEAIEEVRMGALFHLESLVERELRRGSGEAEAVRIALAEYGSPEAAGEGMLDEWCRGRQAMTFARVGPSAFWWSFGYFGLAFGVTLLAVEYAVLWPGGALADVDLLSGLVAGVSASAAGLAAGHRVPTGNLRALALALAPLVPYSLLVGWIAAPNLDPKVLLNLLITWALVGGATLSLAAWFKRHGRPPVSRKVLS